MREAQCWAGWHRAQQAQDVTGVGEGHKQGLGVAQGSSQVKVKVEQSDRRQWWQQSLRRGMQATLAGAVMGPGSRIQSLGQKGPRAPAFSQGCRLVAWLGWILAPGSLVLWS